MSVLGAIVMYILSLASLFRLRRIEPRLERPFLTPAYPLFPIIALLLALVSLVAIVYYNPVIAAIFLVAGIAGGIWSQWRARRGLLGNEDAMLVRPKAG